MYYLENGNPINIEMLIIFILYFKKCIFFSESKVLSFVKYHKIGINICQVKLRYIEVAFVQQSKT